MSNLTPFQHDVEMMIRILEIELPRIGAADEALTRRIVRPDSNRAEDVRVHTSGTTDPCGEEAMQRITGQENREAYRDSLQKIWRAIKAHRWETDYVLKGEPTIARSGKVCETRKGTPTACTNFASPHTQPESGMVVEEFCDGCWLGLCMRCCMRPRDEYRPTCDACRKRDERRVVAA